LSAAGELIEAAVRCPHVDPRAGVVRVRIPDDVCPCSLQLGGGLLRVVDVEERHQARAWFPKKAK